MHWSLKTPLIQQNLINGNIYSDVLLRGNLNYSNVTFDPSAPPAVLPEGVFSPLNADNAFFKHEAFWALLFPTSEATSQQSVLRGYWAQRLLWEVGGHIGFFPPNAYRNSSTSFTDHSLEYKQYNYTLLIDFLTSWQCPGKLSFFLCVELLSRDLAQHGFWDHSNADVTSLWLKDLIDIGYEEPVRADSRRTFHHLSLKEKKLIQEKKDEDFSKINLDLALKRSLTLYNSTFVNFAAVDQTNKLSVAKYRHKLRSYCADQQNITFTTDVDLTSRTRQKPFSDILLIVIYNHFKYLSENIHFLEMMHRYYFPNIVYCGGGCNKECFRQIMENVDFKISFIDAPIFKGYHGHLCVSRAMHMNYQVSDYMVVGDDSLINTWNLHKLDRKKIWHQEDNEKFHCFKGTENLSWWPRYIRYFKATLEVLRRQMRDDVFNHRNTRITRFFTNLSNNTGYKDGCVNGISDFYYIPKYFLSDFLYFLDFFGEYEIFLELAVPMSIHGITYRSNITTFLGKNVWEEDRKRIWEFYNPDVDAFLHPIKFSYKVNLRGFCKYYIKHILLNV